MLSYTKIEKALINDANTYAPIHLSTSEQNTLIQYYRFLTTAINERHGILSPDEYKQIIGNIMEEVMHKDLDNIFIKQYYRYAIEHPESQAAKLKATVTPLTYKTNIIAICSYLIRAGAVNNAIA